MVVRSRALAAPRSGQTAISLTMVFFLVASFVASLIGASPVAAQAVDTTLAESVPSDSVIYLDLDLDQSSDQWTQVFALLDRAGLTDLAEEEVDASPEEIGQVAEMYEFTGSAALVFTDADALTATTVDEVTDQAMSGTGDPSELTEDIPEGMVVLFQPDDPAALHANFQQTVTDEAESNGTVAETTEYNGVTIDFWTSDDPAIAPTATALVGDTVVLAVRPDDVGSVIDTVNGELESLATNENFLQVAGAFQTDSISFGYIDATTIGQAAIAADPTLAELSAGYDASQAGYAGWNFYVDDSGFRLDTVTITANGEAPSILTPAMAERMPAGSLMFVNGTDIAGSGISELLGYFLQMALSETDLSTPETVPSATPDIDEIYAQLETQLGFNIKTDLIDQMDGEWALAVDAEMVFSDSPDVDVVFVSEVADDVTVADATDQIAFIVGSAIDSETADISEREVDGGTVTTVTVQDMMSPGVPGVIEWAVIDGEFLVGLNDGIDSYLDGSAEVLADDPIYQQTLAALPSSDLVSIQFVNLDLVIPMIEEAAMSMSSSFDVLDNDEACGDYASQEEAQEAYDADEFELWNLDLDYDGEACEDFFDTTTAPVASPESMTEDLHILSVGSVSYVEDGMYRTSSILLIGE